MRPSFFLTWQQICSSLKKIYEATDHINLHTYIVLHPAIL